MMIRYPRIFAELCVWCEQFVNVWKKTPFSAKFSFTDIFFHIRLGSIPEKRHFRPLLPVKAVSLSTASHAFVETFSLPVLLALCHRQFVAAIVVRILGVAFDPMVVEGMDLRQRQ